MPDSDLCTHRLPCGWCGEPDMWPDVCSEAPGRCNAVCIAEIATRCALGDHRRCEPDACAVAARWHAPVRRAGVEAAGAAGAGWAVVSTIENAVVVVGTGDDLGRAGSVRADALRRSGIPAGPEGMGLVYVVRGSDGGLF